MIPRRFDGSASTSSSVYALITEQGTNAANMELPMNMPQDIETRVTIDWAGNTSLADIYDSFDKVSACACMCVSAWACR